MTLIHEGQNAGLSPRFPIGGSSSHWLLGANPIHCFLVHDNCFQDGVVGLQWITTGATKAAHKNGGATTFIHHAAKAFAVVPSDHDDAIDSHQGHF